MQDVCVLLHWNKKKISPLHYCVLESHTHWFTSRETGEIFKARYQFASTKGRCTRMHNLWCGHFSLMSSSQATCRAQQLGRVSADQFAFDLRLIWYLKGTADSRPSLLKPRVCINARVRGNVCAVWLCWILGGTSTLYRIRGWSVDYTNTRLDAQHELSGAVTKD